MATIGLSFYSIKVFMNGKRKAEKSYYKLSNIEGSSIDLIVYDYLKNEALKYKNDDVKERLSKVDYAEIDQHNCNGDYYFNSLKAIVKTGSYGVETEIVKSASGDVAYTQDRYEASVRPFGFCLYYSEGIETGLLVSQSFGTSGISTFLKNTFRTIVNNYNPELFVEIKSVTPNEYMEKIVNTSSISDIYVEKAVRQTKGDLTNKDDKIFDSSRLEVHYKKPLINDKEKLLNLLLQRKSLKGNELAFLTSEGEEITNLKFSCKVNKKKKTFNYNTYFNMRITEDITDKVEIDINTGHPGRESLFNVIDDTSLWYLQAMGIIADNKNNSVSKVYNKLFYTKIIDKNENDKEVEVIEKANEDNAICV